MKNIKNKNDVISVKCSKIRYFDEPCGAKAKRTVTVDIDRGYLEACAGGDLCDPELDSDPDFADAIKDAVEEKTGMSVSRLEYSMKF